MSLVDVTAALTDSSIQYQPPSFFDRRSLAKVVGSNYIAVDRRVLACVDARAGYVSQVGTAVGLQAYGSVYNLGGGSDVTGTLVDGSTTRFARVADPDDAGKWCWYSRVNSGDPDTSGTGAKRCEWSLTGNAVFEEKNARVMGVCIRMQDWRALTDDQLVWQVHGPDASSVTVPWLILWVDAGVFKISLWYDTNASPSLGTVQSIDLFSEAVWSPLTWYRFAIFVREDWSGNGRVQVLRNGVQIVNYSGPVGVNDQALGGSYMKSGYYHWTSGNAWDASVATREIWHKGPYIVSEAVPLAEMDAFLVTL